LPGIKATTQVQGGANVPVMGEKPMLLTAPP
jgi:hypothetical protein